MLDDPAFIFAVALPHFADQADQLWIMQHIPHRRTAGFGKIEIERTRRRFIGKDQLIKAVRHQYRIRDTVDDRFRMLAFGDRDLHADLHLLAMYGSGGDCLLGIRDHFIDRVGQ